MGQPTTSDKVTSDKVPAAFATQVKETLEHLHEFAYLQEHSLAQEISSGRSVGQTAGQRLRGVLLDAIEALNPGPEVPFRAPQARLHNLLQMHYVETMTVQECAREMSISERQAYRDLRRAEENVATLLWAQRYASEPPDSEQRASHLSSVQREVDRLTAQPSAIDVWTLVDRARKAVLRLAEQRGVEPVLVAPSQPIIVQADPVLAQQVITGVLSQVVQQALPGSVTITFHIGDKANLLRLYYSIQEAEGVAQPGQVVEQLAGRLGWVVDADVNAAGEVALVIQLSVRAPTVLVIDDNEGLVSLLERFLIDHAYRVVPAASGRMGLQLARNMAPDAIVLDVIMPDMDGWEVLQALRDEAQTASIPIIICSVFDDPRLAESLGASACLPKPISRSEVLETLQMLGVV